MARAVATRNRCPLNPGALLTRRQVADFLGCSTDTVDRRIRSGKLRALIDGRLVRISVVDLDLYVRGAKRWR